MKRLEGIAAAKGIAIGPAWVYRPDAIAVEQYQVLDIQAELLRFRRAADRAKEQLEEIHLQAEEGIGSEQAAIFEAHKMFLEDPALLESIESEIGGGKNAEAALQNGIEGFAQQLAAAEDPYFRERAADVRDAGQRVLRVLVGAAKNTLATIDNPSIIVASDLTPSETVLMRKTLTLGFATARGGLSSHTTILARSLGLPAIVGLGDAGLDAILHGETLVLDGNAGVLIVEPDEPTLADYRSREEKWRAELESTRSLAQMPAVTRDGHRVEVVANIGSVESAHTALEFGAEGVGLLRTEFIFLERTILPDEEEQYAIYHAIADVMGDRPLVIRTFDIGGDKPPSYMEWAKEANPFLGWRAIRVSLANTEMFKVQLRAILRAGLGHNIKIMFPMIATIEELRQARRCLDEARSELKTRGAAFAEQVEMGIMIEVPSAAFTAQFLAREADFFSIGTNDLIQYTFAADRGNEKVAYLYEPLHPAILHVLKKIIDDAHAAGKWVGMCGEMAGDLNAVALLLGLGLDEFSVNPAAIPEIKSLIRSLDLPTVQALASQVLTLATAAEIRARVLEMTRIKAKVAR